MQIAFIQKNCSNVIGGWGEPTPFFLSHWILILLHWFFCVIPPKLTVMYFTDEPYKTIYLTKKNMYVLERKGHFQQLLVAMLQHIKGKQVLKRSGTQKKYFTFSCNSSVK